MKLNNQTDRNNRKAVSSQPQAPDIEIKVEGKDPIDDFRAVVFHSGKRLLDHFYAKGLELDAERYRRAIGGLGALENFQYNIAFAGEQSSGKSTVINALIEYPMMPTCKLTTTCVGTKIIYSEKPRIIVVDDDTKKKVMDVDCTNMSEQHFRKLKEYACVESSYKLIENLQYFTDRNLFSKNETLSLDTINELQMNRSDPNHVALLVMILLTVYVDQNSTDLTPKAEAVIRKRNEVLRFFNFPSKTLNYSITLLWNGEFLKSGITITDLPGLGAYAPDKEVNGKVQKGHDSITTDALGGSTDAMVFLVDPEVRNGGAPAIEAMLSNANLREMIGDEVIIPVINKIDLCEGDAIVEQSIDGFMSLIKGAGVKKNREDIKLCSSFFGESEYKDFPIERTCFYKRKFTSMYEEVEYDSYGESEQEIIEEVKKKLRKRLKIAYLKKSHIEELKQFFRSAYVQKGKCYKVYAALLEVIGLSESTYNSLVAKKQGFGSLKDLQADMIAKVTKSVKDYATKPVDKAMKDIAPIVESSLDAADSKVKNDLNKIPDQYSSAFKSAVEGYKKKLLNISNDFYLYGGGLLSYKARIDEPGSKNRSLYLQLTNECKSMNIDIKSVNGSYSNILDYVSGDISKIYDRALDRLRETKKSFSKSMQGAIKEMLKDEELAGASEAVKELSKSVTVFVEKQISTLENNAEVSKSSINSAGKEVANSIIRFNSECASSFSLSVVKQVKDSLAPGSIFASREYITVDGPSGIKEMFNSLSYTSSDKSYMESKVRETGTVNIYNNINTWYSDASSTILMMFTELSDQINKLMKSTTDMLSKNVYEQERQFEEVAEQISDCEREIVLFRKEVQPLFDLTLNTTNDSKLFRYQGDIFKNLNLKG